MDKLRPSQRPSCKIVAKTYFVASRNIVHVTGFIQSPVFAATVGQLQISNCPNINPKTVLTLTLILIVILSLFTLISLLNPTKRHVISIVSI